jgi:hypothetical protein
VTIALQTGASIVPCYSFGNTQTFYSFPRAGSLLERLSRRWKVSLLFFWGRCALPIPRRVPLLTVLGKPPSPELVNEYHEMYLQRTREIYDKYKNMFGWSQRPLLFKR